MNKQKIIVLSGSSADGKTSIKKNSSSKDFGKGLTKSMFEPINKWRGWCDIVIVGRNTVLNDNPSLITGLKTGSLRGVIDRNLELDYFSDKLNILKGNNSLMVFTTREPTRRQKELKEVIFVTLDKNIFFKDMCNKLSNIGIFKVLFEAGGNLTSLLLNDNIVDEIIFAHFPFIIGGKNTPSLCDGTGIKTIEDRIKLKLLNVNNIDHMIVCHYKIIKDNKL